jgi:hypothetical protein
MISAALGIFGDRARRFGISAPFREDSGSDILSRQSWLLGLLATTRHQIDRHVKAYEKEQRRMSITRCHMRYSESMSSTSYGDYSLHILYWIAFRTESGEQVVYRYKPGSL